MKIHIASLFTGLLLSSCIGIKYLKPGEKILFDQKIITDNKVEKTEINDQLKQKTNSHLLIKNLRPQVYLYRWGLNKLDTSKILKQQRQTVTRYDASINKTKSSARKSRLNSRKIQKIENLDRKLKEGNLRMRWGEKLVTFDSAKAELSKQSLKTYTFSKGYFNAEIDYKIIPKGSNAVKVRYNITKNEPYRIDSVIYVIQDDQMKTRYEDKVMQSKLAGKRYMQEQLTSERERLYELLSNNGYYDFKRQYIIFRLDSTILDNHRLVLEVSIVNPLNSDHHKQVRIDSVTFNTESSLSRRTRRKPLYYNNVTYDFRGKNKYEPKLLDWRVFIHKDSLYSSSQTIETQRQLSYLDVFKFVNINYDSSGGQFIANIFTSPLKKYQTSSEAGLSVFEQSNGFPGPFLNFNAKSRNIFGGLEIIQFDGSASIQGVRGVQEEGNYSRLQYGGEVSVTFPQFLFPLNKSIKEKIGKYNPRTKFASGANFEFRRLEYTRNTFNTNMSYIWQVKDDIQFTLKPFDVSLIKSDNTSSFQQDLDSISETGARSLVSAFYSSFVSFSSFSFNLNKNSYGITNNDSYNFRAYIENGGNLNNLFNIKAFDSLEYYNYLKTSLDFRRNNRLTRKSAFAYRINIGFAYLYNNKLNALPYEKYFYGGGSNSIRAWRPRRLGPGAFTRFYDENDEEYISIASNQDKKREQPGEIILETSFEFRHDLIGFIDYAFFLDAGNIWLRNSKTVDPSEDPQGDDGVFHFNSFFREIAVGGGFGLRFDFSFLVLRFDLAYKFVDPAYPVGDRFIVFDKYKSFKDLIDFGDKAIINIGIGHPF